MIPKERIIPVFIPHEGCLHQCAFCNQHTIAGQGSAPTPGQVAAMIEQGARRAGKGAEVAFYGGSFTAIGMQRMQAYLEATDRFRQDGTISGVRVSTRPDAVDDGICRVLLAHGVRLVELGAQSMRDEVLSASARGHTAEAVRRAAACIKANRLELGLQMMTGLPGDDDSGAVETANALIALQPAVVRIYPTLVLPGTALSALLRAGRYAPQTLEQAVELCARLYGLFTAAHIRVIRMGLNESRELAEGVEAGPYHPAFGELVLATCYRMRAEALVANADYRGKELVLRVPKGEESQMAGQKRINLEYLRRLTGAKRVRVNPRETTQDEVFVCI